MLETLFWLALGAFVGWNKNPDGAGLGITASFASGRGTYNISRPLVSGAESGSGVASVDTTAAQVKASYTFLPSDGLSVTPYLGLRYSTLEVGGYKESGFGREMGQAGFDEFTEVKTIHIRIGARDRFFK